MLSFSLVRSSVVFAFSVALLASSSASAEGRHGSRAPDVRGADVVLTAPGLSAREARDYRGAVLVERGALRDDIRRLDAQIDALSAISLRAHPPLRDALCHQISALKADVSQLRRRLRDAQPVDVRIESRRARTPRWEAPRWRAPPVSSCMRCSRCGLVRCAVAGRLCAAGVLAVSATGAEEGPFALAAAEEEAPPPMSLSLAAAYLGAGSALGLALALSRRSAASTRARKSTSVM